MIKNEQEYLDEWIRYHLNLGIHHIFIFEDIDSDSHKEICDKYINNVSLNSVSLILNKNDLATAFNLKKTKKWNIQHVYFRNILNYIKKLNIFEWCFVIDADEFITLEKGLFLNNIFDLYGSYDAFIMQWKCYGANGYINKPDYSNKGVIDTFQQEITGSVSDNPASFIKTCYNMPKYDDSFFFNQHHPKEICNWCNTDFIKDWNKPVYSNIYIRHYITKSWEEYLWKLNSRGYCWGRARKVDQFFSINDDMISLKQFLINKWIKGV